MDRMIHHIMSRFSTSELNTNFLYRNGETYWIQINLWYIMNPGQRCAISFLYSQYFYRGPVHIGTEFTYKNLKNKMHKWVGGFLLFFL